ncbi:ATP-binding cassette domain-containing protein, partial [Burkholderia stabilis]
MTDAARHATDGDMIYATVDLTLKAGERTLLDGFTHAFRPGEIWCVAGPNGAGKTTLLATLAG